MQLMKRRSFNILLVDDNPADCFLISTILKGARHNVEAVHDGKEAIKLFAMRPNDFDFLIVDHNMPLMSGLELVQHFRKNEFSGRIIVISGALTDELFLAYRAKRVDKILQKTSTFGNLPFVLDELFDQDGMEAVV